MRNGNESATKARAAYWNKFYGKAILYRIKALGEAIVRSIGGVFLGVALIGQGFLFMTVFGLCHRSFIVGGLQDIKAGIASILTFFIQCKPLTELEALVDSNPRESISIEIEALSRHLSLLKAMKQVLIHQGFCKNIKETECRISTIEKDLKFFEDFLKKPYQGLYDSMTYHKAYLEFQSFEDS